MRVIGVHPHGTEPPDTPGRFNTANDAVPDTSAGNHDNSWLGQHQRGYEHTGTLALTQMGARVYAPHLGRFLSTDPVEGGSSNDYDYVAGNPVDNTDLDGRWCRAGIGTTCTRYVQDRYGRTVPVQARFRAKVRTKHNLQWSTVKWLIRTLPQTGGSGTRVEYGSTLYELRCTIRGCQRTGQAVYVTMSVDFKSVNGRTFGFITSYCVGMRLCPGWVNSKVRL